MSLDFEYLDLELDFGRLWERTAAMAPPSNLAVQSISFGTRANGTKSAYSQVESEV